MDFLREGTSRSDETAEPVSESSMGAPCALTKALISDALPRMPHLLTVCASANQRTEPAVLRDQCTCAYAYMHEFIDCAKSG